MEKFTIALRAAIPVALGVYIGMLAYGATVKAYAAYKAK